MITWLKKKLPSIFNLKPGHEMEIAFWSGGVPYMKMVNEQKIPYKRAMAAIDINKELEERADAKYQKTSYKLILEYLRKGDNINAGIVAVNALERMENICNVDLMYKLASVLYIGPDEDLYNYDYEYAEKKINKWKKDNDIEDFFLQTPLADYLPSFDGLGINIMDYTKAQRLAMIQTLKNHLSILSVKSKNQELCSTLKLQIEELEELVTNN